MKMSIRGYMLIDYTHPTSGDVIECMLVGVDFEEEIFYLCIPDSSQYKSGYPYGTFPANIKNCKKGKTKLKKV